MNKRFHILAVCLLLSFFCTISMADDKVNEEPIYIIGHWNYPDNSVIPVYVISEGEDVELFINGISFGHGRKESKNLFTFDNVIFQPGTLTAVSYDASGKEQAQQSLITSGVPAQMKLTVAEPSDDSNSDEVLIQCEVTDFYGRRCLHDNRTVIFEIEEPSDWINVPNKSNESRVRFKQLQLHKGENSISVKKPSGAGQTKINVKSPGLAQSSVTLKSN